MWRKHSSHLKSSAKAALPCPQDGWAPQKATGVLGFPGLEATLPKSVTAAFVPTSVSVITVLQ